MEKTKNYKNVNESKTYIVDKWYKCNYDSDFKYFKFSDIRPDYEKDGTSAINTPRFYYSFGVLIDGTVIYDGQITNGNIDYSSILVDEKEVFDFLLNVNKVKYNRA